MSLESENTTLRAKNAELVATNESFLKNFAQQESEIKNLKLTVRKLHKLAFGKKSERIIASTGGWEQLYLGADYKSPLQNDQIPETQTVAQHARKKSKQAEDVSGGKLRFDESLVEVKQLEILPAEVEGLVEGQDFDVISQECVDRLACKPAAHYVIRECYKRVKLKDKILQAPSRAVFEGSFLDASTVVNFVVEKLLSVSYTHLTLPTKA